MKKNASLITKNSGGLVVILILAMGGIYLLLVRGIFLVLSSKKTTTPKKIETRLSEKKEDDSLMLSKLGILYDLPKTEKPTIATVSDKSKLQKQSFFDKAENGDKVIIYAIAKKAILYRPSLNKIMEIAPLSLSEPTGVPIKPSTSTSSGVLR